MDYSNIDELAEEDSEKFVRIGLQTGAGPSTAADEGINFEPMILLIKIDNLFSSQQSKVIAQRVSKGGVKLKLL